MADSIKLFNDQFFVEELRDVCPYLSPPAHVGGAGHRANPSRIRQRGHQAGSRLATLQTLSAPPVASKPGFCDKYMTVEEGLSRTS
jgi:hypothetical protein